MIINSKFKDYYDYLVKHGQDKTIIYNRNQEEVLKEEIFNKRLFDELSLLSYSYTTLNSFYGPDTGIIGFCGQFFPYVYLIKKSHSGLLMDQIKKHYYSGETIQSKFIDKLNIIPNANKVTNRWSQDCNSVNGTNRFKEIKKLASDEPFIKLNVPIFLVENHNSNNYFRTNPQLSLFNFQQVKDPYTAYQEIMMYLSGVLGNQEKATVAISDVDMAAKKGFDKWSFRKQSLNK